MAKGDYAALVLPLDLEMLVRLPIEGTTLGKYKPLSVTTKSLLRQLDDEELKASDLNSRIRSLNILGLVVKVTQMGGHGAGWQRTQKAEDLLREHGYIKDEEPDPNPQPTDPTYDTDIKGGWFSGR